MNVSMLVVALSSLAACASLALPPEPVPLGYHERVGVPAAARIERAERALRAGAGGGPGRVVGGAGGGPGRVVGGAGAPVGTYPFLVGLVIRLTSGATSVCGASLLSSSRALTAAHCWFDGRSQARQLTLVLGSTWLFFGGTRVLTDRVEVHQQYDPATLSNDVAIISFDHVAYTDIIQAVALPDGDILSSDLTGARAHAVGYGKTSDSSGISTNQIQNHVSLEVISNTACHQVYGSIVAGSTLCTSGAGGVGPCGGDSGGPLVVSHRNKPVLVGVTSFAAARGCQAGFPAGFSRVTFFLSWIKARI